MHNLRSRRSLHVTRWKQHAIPDVMKLRYRLRKIFEKREREWLKKWKREQCGLTTDTIVEDKAIAEVTDVPSTCHTPDIIRGQEPMFYHVTFELRHDEVGLSSSEIFQKRDREWLQKRKREQCGLTRDTAVEDKDMSEPMDIP